MALSGATIEAGLAAWLASTTGLVVRWERQKVAQPPEGTDYASLRILTYGNLVARPAQASRLDVTRPAGSQLVTTLRSPGLLSIRAQVYTRATVGESAAFWLLSKAADALEAPSVSDALELAGLGLAGRGTVQDVATLVNTRDQGRAALDVRFNVTGVVTDFGTWIETLVVTPQIT